MALLRFLKLQEELHPAKVNDLRLQFVQMLLLDLFLEVSLIESGWLYVIVDLCALSDHVLVDLELLVDLGEVHV